MISMNYGDVIPKGASKETIEKRQEERSNRDAGKGKPAGGEKPATTATPAPAAKPEEKKSKASLTEKDVEDYIKKQEGEVGKIEKQYTKAAGDISKQTEKYQQQLDVIDKKTKELDKKSQSLADEQADFTTKKLEETKKLTDWHKDLATSYGDIAKRFREEIDTAFSAEEKGRMKKEAQQDYLSMQALGGKAAQIGLGAGGPVTGAQQQLMMAQSGAAATDAYSAALNRISAIEEQRRAMGFQIAGASMQQELANRQAGYQMDVGRIETESNLMMNRFNTGMQSVQSQRQGVAALGVSAGEKLRTGLESTAATTQAATYGAEARMALNTAGMQQRMGIDQLRVQEETGIATANAYGNMPGPYQPSMGQKFLTGAAAGAGVGATFGPWGALAGGVGGGLISAFS